MWYPSQGQGRSATEKPVDTSFAGVDAIRLLDGECFAFGGLLGESTGDDGMGVRAGLTRATDREQARRHCWYVANVRSDIHSHPPPWIVAGRIWRQNSQPCLRETGEVSSIMGENSRRYNLFDLEIQLTCCIKTIQTPRRQPLRRLSHSRILYGRMNFTHCGLGLWRRVERIFSRSGSAR